MSVSQIISLSKKQLNGNYGPIFCAMFAIFGVNYVLNFIPFIGSILGTVVLTPLLSLGMLKMYFALSRNESVSVSTLFEGFNFGFKGILLNLVYSLTLLPGIILVVIGVINFSIGMIVLGAIVIAILSLKGSLCLMALADNPDASVFDCIKASYSIVTFSFLMKQLWMSVLFIPASLLGILTFGIYFLWLAPRMGLSMVNLYKEYK